MAILNLTPDSFSDGGRWKGTDAALAQADRLLSDGAHLLDLGAESTRPGAVTVDVEEEWRRLAPVLQALTKGCPVPISVDTRHAEVARRALDCGAEIINDVSCAADPALLEFVAKSQGGYVLMHSRGTPENMRELSRYSDLLPEVLGELECSLQKVREAGVSESSICVDPGFGFAKTVEQNWSLLENLKKLQTLERPILVGLSRKSMLRAVVDSEENLPFASAIAALMAWERGAAIFRVHDVRETALAFRIFKNIGRGDHP